MLNIIQTFREKLGGAARSAAIAEKDKQHIDTEMALGAWADDAILDGILTNPDDLINNKTLDIIDEMLNDDALGSYINMKINARLATPPVIEPVSDSNEDMRIAEFIRWALFDYPYTGIRDFLRHTYSALPYGFSLSEKVLKYIDFGKWKGKYAYCDFIPQNPHHYEFELDQGKRVAAYGIINSTTSSFRKKLPRDKFVHYVNNSQWGNPYGKSDITKAYKWYIGKKYGLRFWLIFLERLAGGFVVAKHEHLDDKQRSNLKDIIDHISGKTSIMIPNTVDISVFESNGVGGSVYRDSIDSFDIKMARSVLIPDLLGISAKPTGSYALGKKHFDVFLWVLRAMGEDLQRVIGEQVIEPLVAMNFGAQYSAPRFNFEPLTMEDRLEILASYYTAIEKGVTVPTDETREWVHKMLNAPQYKSSEVESSKKKVMIPRSEVPQNEIEKNADHFTMRAFTDYEAKVNFSEIVDAWDALEEATINEWSEIAILQRDAVLKLARKWIEEKNNKAIWKLRLPKVSKVKELLVNALVTSYLNARYEGWREVKDTLADKFAVDRFADILLEPVPPREAIKHFKSKGIGIKPAEIANYRNKAFLIAGIEKEKILAESKAAILRGLQKGDIAYSQAEIRRIFDGYIQTGEIRNGKLSAPYRVENIVRTNLSEAYNEGRRASFIDPDVIDYIEAYQVSAVLDDNTTDLCMSMDGKVLSKEELDSFGWPPWHYQCRTLVIPIVRGEEFEIDGIPPGTKQQFGPGGRKPRVSTKISKVVIGPQKVAPEEWLKNLTPKEIKVAKYWQSSGYSKIRDFQRLSKNEFIKKYSKELYKQTKDITESMISALEKDGQYQGTIYRGLYNLSYEDYTKLVDSKELQWRAMSSASKKPEVAYEFASYGEEGNNIVFEIKQFTAVDMEPIFGAEEAEVIMREGRKYRVVDIIENATGEYIHEETGFKNKAYFTLMKLVEVAV